jgi:hypothetical protein
VSDGPRDCIDSNAGTLVAERVVTRVRGVRAVANDSIVRWKVDVASGIFPHAP